MESFALWGPAVLSAAASLVGVVVGLVISHGLAINRSRTEAFNEFDRAQRARMAELWLEVRSLVTEPLPDDGAACLAVWQKLQPIKRELQMMVWQYGSFPKQPWRGEASVTLVGLIEGVAGPLLAIGAGLDTKEQVDDQYRRFQSHINGMWAKPPKRASWFRRRSQ